MQGADIFFVDSNILLYYVDPAEESKRKCAAEWLDGLWSAGAGRISWQVLHEFYWNAVKKMHLESGHAREIVTDLSYWQPVDSSLGLAQQAWHFMDTTQVTYWDALILAAAERSGARYLLSEDFQAGRRYGEVEAISPFASSPANFRL